MQPFLQLCERGQRGRSSRIGRPRKYPGVWEHTIKRICITTATYSKWLVVKEEGVNDDAVAQHLLSVLT